MDSYSTARWILRNTFNNTQISDVLFISYHARKPKAKIFIIGPNDSLYAHGLFVCRISLNYKRKVTLRFKTPILHPDVTSDGLYQGNLNIPSNQHDLKEVLLNVLQTLRRPDWTHGSSPSPAEEDNSSQEACNQAVVQHTKAWAF